MSLPPWITQKTSHYIKCIKTARKTFPEFHDKVIALADLVDTSAELTKLNTNKSWLQNEHRQDCSSISKHLGSQISRGNCFTSLYRRRRTRVNQNYFLSSSLPCIQNRQHFLKGVMEKNA